MSTSLRSIGPSELQKLGVPLDGEVLERSPEVSFLPDVKVFDSTISATKSGEAFLMILTSICNISQRVVRLAECRINAPWYDSTFSLLVSKACVYSSPEGPYDRKSVLNHRFGSQGKLHPGDELYGSILAEGPETIPYEYQDKDEIDVKLEIWDNQRKLCCKKVHLDNNINSLERYLRRKNKEESTQTFDGELKRAV